MIATREIGAVAVWLGADACERGAVAPTLARLLTDAALLTPDLCQSLADAVDPLRADLRGLRRVESAVDGCLRNGHYSLRLPLSVAEALRDSLNAAIPVRT